MTRSRHVLTAMGFSIMLAAGPALADDGDSSSSSGSSGSSDSGSSGSLFATPDSSASAPSTSGDSAPASGGSTSAPSDPSGSSSGSSSGTSSGSNSGGSDSTEGGKKSDPANEPAPNGLKGLFVPQPQYPTPGTTIMNPDNIPAHLGNDGNQPGRQPGQPGQVFTNEFGKEVTPPSENKDNPLKGLFQMQPQYPSPNKTIMFPESGVPKNLGDSSTVPGSQPGQAGSRYDPESSKSSSSEPSGNKDNVLKGLFQMQPQYPSPGKTVMFPEPVPSHLGGTAGQPGSQPGQAPAVFTPAPFADMEQKLQEQAAAISAANGGVVTEKPGEKAEGAEGGEAKKAEGKEEGKEKTKEEKEKEEKDKDKDKDKAKEEGKEEGKEKTAEEKSKEEKEKEEKAKEEGKEKSAEEKAKEKEEGKEKSAEEKAKEGKEKSAEEKAKEDGKEKSPEEKAKDEKGEKDKEGKAKKEEVKYDPYHPLKEAILLMNTGKHQQALEVLSTVLTKNPQDVQAYYTRAVLRVLMRQYTQAADDYRQVIKLAPKADVANMARAGLNKIHF